MVKLVENVPWISRFHRAESNSEKRLLFEMLDNVKRLCIIPTDLCNMTCEFCLTTETRKKQKSIPLKTVERFLEKIRPFGYDTVSLTGGEPCCHPELYDLVDLIVRNGLRFKIVSNGYEFEKYIPLLEYKSNLHSISFSLDAGSQILHDELRMRGSFKKVTDAVSFFSKEGINVIPEFCTQITYMSDSG